jgi:Fic family protein
MRLDKNDIYQIEKPLITELDREEAFDYVFNYDGKTDNTDTQNIFLSGVKPANQNLVNEVNTPIYLPWKKVKHKKLPDEFEYHNSVLTHEVFWAAVKLTRNSKAQKSPIKTETGEFFTWSLFPEQERILHSLDMTVGGNLIGFEAPQKKAEKEKNTVVLNGIIEEAIATSQLEGASTTRAVAKKFLQEGRKPKNKSEHMILNSYLAMKKIEEEYKNKELSLELLFEMHSLITQNTINADEIHRLRKNTDEIVIESDTVGEIIYIPPSESFLASEIQNLIDFANNKNDEYFIHPIIKAVMIHFWIGYLHPFTDGNGRLARLLFFWYLLKHNYWAVSYLPISTVIKKAPAQYWQAYVYSEQDDCDLNYFIDFHLRKIQESIDNFKSYIETKSQENKTINKSLKQAYAFNDRQIQLLKYLSKDENHRTSLTAHVNVYQVTKATGIKDLKALEQEGFLETTKEGKFLYYYGTTKIESLFN